MSHWEDFSGIHILNEINNAPAFIKMRIFLFILRQFSYMYAIYLVHFSSSTQTPSRHILLPPSCTLLSTRNMTKQHCRVGSKENDLQGKEIVCWEV